MVLSSSVNNRIGGLGDKLLRHPTSPYWYLYTLFFIFLVTPTFSGVKMAIIGVIVALTTKFEALSGGDSVYAVSKILSTDIWFVIEMSICVFDVRLKGKKAQGFSRVCCL